MSFSLSTVIMAIITSNVLLIWIYVLFKKSKRLIVFGYKVLVLMILLIFLRLMIPIEFSFTKNIYYYGIFAKIYTIIRHPWIELGMIQLSICLFLGIIWVIGFGVKIVQYIKKYKRTKLLILLMGNDVTNNEIYRESLEQISQRLKLKNRFRIFEIPNIPCPMIFSFYKPYILFPANHQYKEQNVRFCLQHEIAHYKHGDLFIKFLMELLTMIYWWNPCCKRIQKHLDEVLELHVDDSITNQDDSMKENYLTCLLDIKKDSIKQKKNFMSEQMTLSIQNVEESLLEKRFQVMTAKKTIWQKIGHQTLATGIVIISICIYILSYTFVLESKLAFGGPEPENGISSFTLNAENAYIIINDEGTYDIYLYGCYIETVDSLEYYDESIPILNQEETK